MTAPASSAVRSRRSPAPRAISPSIACQQVLEVGALGRGPGPLGTARSGRGLDRDEALLEALEARRDLLAELVHRRVEPGRVQQVRRAWRRRRRSSAPASPPMRPMALSRFVSSNSSSTIERSAPRSPRNFSSVRGSRPSPSAKFARSVCSRAAAARSLTCSAWRTIRSNSVRTASTLTVTPASWRAIRPMRRARSTSGPRSPAGRSPRNAARVGSDRDRRSMTIRSPSSRTDGVERDDVRLPCRGHVGPTRDI